MDGWATGNSRQLIPTWNSVSRVYQNAVYRTKSVRSKAGQHGATYEGKM
jgi:hypothetical protein